MKINGRAIASDILASVRAELSGTPMVRAITLQPSIATTSYLRIKVEKAEEAGMHMDIVELADDASLEDIVAAVEAPGADAVIIQLPLPLGYDTEKAVNAIPVSKDPDVLSSTAYAQFEEGVEGALVPPVAAAVLEVLHREKIDVQGMRTVVVGKGQLVGRPVATVLTRLGADVTTVVKETPNKEALYKQADLIVSGAGAAHIITPEMVKEGVLLIDAGTSGSRGGVAGDIHPDCETRAALFTPVPGGIGPIAVACLFKNTAALFSRIQKQ